MIGGDPRPEPCQPVFETLARIMRTAEVRRPWPHQLLATCGVLLGKGKGQGSGGGVRQETPGITRLGALEVRRAVQPVPDSPKPGSGNHTLPWYIGCDGEHAAGCAGSWAFSLGCSGSG